MGNFSDTGKLAIFKASAASPGVRRETRDNTEYLVAPAVVLVEGVLNGELVLAEEFGAFVDTWNDVPAPVYHPEGDGHAISARDLEIQDQWVIGRFYHAEVVDNRLRGEFWLNVAKAQALSVEAEEVIKRLEAGEPVEVSTGYFREVEHVAGNWNGAPYVSIARHIRPDHVALLPHSIGACSWADGCGTPRANQAALAANEQSEVNMTKPKTLVTLEISLDEQLRRIVRAWYEQVREKMAPSEVWYSVLEVFEDRLIAEGSDGRYWSYPYTATDEGVTFGEPVEVEKTYQPAVASAAVPANNDGGIRMDERNELTGNCGDCPDGQPASDVPVAAQPVTETPATNDGESEPVHADPVISDDDLAALRMLRETLASVGAETFQAAIAGMVQNSRQERDGLVAEIVANSAGQLQASDLSTLSTDVLRKMRGAVAPQVNTGRAPGRSVVLGAQEPQTLAMPSLWQ